MFIKNYYFLLLIPLFMSCRVFETMEKVFKNQEENRNHVILAQALQTTETQAHTLKLALHLCDSGYVKLQLPSEDPVPSCPCKQGSTAPHAQLPAKINSPTGKQQNNFASNCIVQGRTSSFGKVALENARLFMPQHIQRLCSTASMAEPLAACRWWGSCEWSRQRDHGVRPCIKQNLDPWAWSQNDNAQSACVLSPLNKSTERTGA